ncbi:hypothetical protein Godav_025224 [Gossypium davidsonii]|uniref:Uncharacterized protein n=1 Tax=Gossypium davidsonii TaxID=34287 RepID=A0A7J8TAY9_GOSDV|nr:hypothetical protein [Gossypium davidsonii]
MKRLAVGPITTPEYDEWRVRRVNNNILKSSHEGSQSIEEHLQVVPSELEILNKDFERRNAELEKQIEQTEEEKMNLRLDADVQKLEAERLRKGKARAEEDLDSLKIDYKKLRLSMRTVGLGKTSEQWQHYEIARFGLSTWKLLKIVKPSSCTTFRTKLEIEIILWEKPLFKSGR